MPEKSGYAIGVDVGGTFTDIILLGPNMMQAEKVLTTRDPSEGVTSGVRELGRAASRASTLSHATTIATNALLTKTGLAHSALVTNEGFRDVLEIGRQRRPEIYDLSTRRPEPLVARKDRFTVRCRIGHDGKEITPLDLKGAKAVARRVSSGGFQSVSVAFLNSYVNDVHEKAMRGVLRSAGYRAHISISSEVDREYREYERFSTTVVNASLSPLVSSYLKRLVSSLRRSGFAAPVFVMGSDGGAKTVEFASDKPVSVLESGPAAGVIASARLARRLGLGDVLTFDMGGTTAKAGAVEGGEPDIVTEFEAAGRAHSGRSIKGSGYAVRGDFIDLAEVSAGGGTIAWRDAGGRLQVGPQSAGSNPGPACYGRGGSLPTVTDANVVLGRLSPRAILGGKMRIRKDLAVAALRRLAGPSGRGVESVATDILAIVNHDMSHAISIVSTERSRDPRRFTLIAFGGAGPLHACDLAEGLGIGKVFVPVHAGLFSAYGLLAGEFTMDFSAPVRGTPKLHGAFGELEAALGKEMESQGFTRYEVRRYYEARYRGQAHELLLPYRGDQSVRRAFDAKHRSLFGYSSLDPLEVVNIRARAVVPGDEFDPPRVEAGGSTKPKARRAWVAGEWHSVNVHVREGTPYGSRGRGPCIFEEYDSTAVVNPSWRWRAEEYGLVLAR